MDKSKVLKFLNRYKIINKIVDNEVKRLSLSDKLRQMTALLMFASQIKIHPDKKTHLSTNWTLLKSKI